MAGHTNASISKARRCSATVTILTKATSSNISLFDSTNLDWAKFYDEYHEKVLDIKAMEKQINDLIGDDEIQKQQGVIPYVLTGDEHNLDLRAFPDKIKLAVWEKQNHKCAICGKEFDYQFMEGDHITPWRDGGRTEVKNCQMLCRECNRRKGSK